LNAKPDNSPFPERLEIVDNSLCIVWDDGTQQSIPVHKLRSNCPCATCREKSETPKPLLPVLSSSEAQPLKIELLRPVGNYGYAIQFSDGHQTGVFTLEYLYSNPQFR
jgi:DUF971 family protein